jgi:hypothetical protein
MVVSLIARWCAYLRRWDNDRTLDRIHHALYVQCRGLTGREVSPTVAIIDSQSAKERRKRGRSVDPCAYDAGQKKFNGKKRHLLVDTQGLLLCVPSSMRLTVETAIEECC